MLRDLGAVTVVADEVSRSLLQPGKPLLDRVLEAFGREYARPDGSLDRAALGRLVFADDEARQRLEALTHPAMLAGTRRLIEEAEERGAAVVAIEAAVLYVMGADRLVDRVILVTADREERLRRLMARDGLSRQQADERLRLHERLGLDHPPADVVIDTTAGIEDTRRRVLEVWRELTGEGV